MNTRWRRPVIVGLLAGAVAAAFASQSRAADTLNQCRADAMFVFDASGSMGTTDYAVKKPRIAHAKDAMRKVVPEVAPLRKLGLIVYGEGEYNDCNSIDLRFRPMADAGNRMIEAVEGINPRGRTPLTESVRRAAEVLDYTQRESVVVLMTDGEETCGGDPCKVASSLKAAGPKLTIHVIGYREGQNTYFKARCMADLTGGQYFPVSTEEELVKALRATLGCPFVTDHRPSFRSYIGLPSFKPNSSPTCRVSTERYASEEEAQSGGQSCGPFSFSATLNSL
jgi:Ca-activated chloride channel family protein